MASRNAQTVGGKDAGRAILEALNKYNADVREALAAELERAAKDMRKEIKATARRRSGRYAKGWAIKRWSRGYALGRTIYNQKVPGLPHLLEHGHAKRGGGRVAGDHAISRAVEPRLEEMEANMIRILEKGGG